MVRQAHHDEVELHHDEMERELFERGYARITRALSADACMALRALYEREPLFRSRVVMERHNFGSGEYKYFAYPLPDDFALELSEGEQHVER